MCLKAVTFFQLLSHSLLNRDYPNTCINQFPNEMILTAKDPLAVVCRRAAPATLERTEQVNEDQEEVVDGPKWLPVTYNLVEELSQFVSYFQRRESR